MRDKARIAKLNGAAHGIEFPKASTIALYAERTPRFLRDDTDLNWSTFKALIIKLIELDIEPFAVTPAIMNAIVTTLPERRTKP